jgi:hypothetical protein
LFIFHGGWVLVVRYNTERVLIGFAVAGDLGSQYLVVHLTSKDSIPSQRIDRNKI